MAAFDKNVRSEFIKEEYKYYNNKKGGQAEDQGFGERVLKFSTTCGLTLETKTRESKLHSTLTTAIISIITLAASTIKLMKVQD